MGVVFTKVTKGLTFKPESSQSTAVLGDVQARSDDNKLHFNNGTIDSPLVTEASSVTLTNKTIVPSSNTITLTSAHILVGNGSAVATDVAMSGDATISNTGAVTIGSIAGVTIGTPTGTGNVVLSASPTFTGTITAATITASGAVTGSNLSGSSSGTNTGDVTLAAVGSTPNANAASLSGQVLNLQPADGTHPGVVSITTQTFGGNKTFSGTISASNLSGTNTGDQTITLTGNVTGSGTGSFATTIAGNAVTDAMLAQIPAHSYHGNNTGSTANVANITSTQLTADLNLFTSSLQGLTPSSSGGTTNFLRADGTWAPPSGSASSSAKSFNNQTGTTYTLALTDGSNNGNNPMLTMNNASPQTVTIPTNSSVAFPIGSEVDIMQLGTGQVVVVGASGVTLNFSALNNGGSAIAGQYEVVRLIQTSANVWNMDGETGITITATGGTITTNGNYKVHTFNSSGTFTISVGSGNVASLIVAGGGGGGNSGGGGGGAGGLIYTTPGTVLGVGNYTVTVGGGGAAGSSSGIGAGSDGGNSSFANSTGTSFTTLTATGGGGGGGGNGTGSQGAGLAGGSGGGDALYAGGGGAGTAGQGYHGGSGTNSGLYTSGGGGGAGAAGQDSTGTAGGNGGVGVSNSITGPAVFYAGGGGGNGSGTGTHGLGVGGSGGGGNGYASSQTPTAGAANTGGGGGGSTIIGVPQPGGSGVVILTYLV